MLDPSDIQTKIGLLGLGQTVSYINKSSNGLGGITIDIFFSGALSAPDKTKLDNFVAAYTDPPTGTVCTVKDVKSPGTNGGSFTAGTWVTRDLNTVDGSIPFITLASNQITIAPGSYIIHIKVPAFNVGNHQIKLRNITANTYTLGTSAISSNNVTGISEIHEFLAYNVSTVLDIQHICYITNSVGLGCATGFAVSEVYTLCFIQQLVAF